MMIGNIYKIKINKSDIEWYKRQGLNAPKHNGKTVRIVESGTKFNTWLVRLVRKDGGNGNYDYLVRRDDLT